MSTHDQLLDYAPLEHQQRRLESGMTQWRPRLRSP